MTAADKKKVVEVTQVAAYLSGAMRFQGGRLFKKINDELFKVVGHMSDVPTPENMFTDNSYGKGKKAEIERRNDFWMLLRNKDCHIMAALFVRVLQTLVDQDTELQHEGERVVNFFCVNQEILLPQELREMEIELPLLKEDLLQVPDNFNEEWLRRNS